MYWRIMAAIFALVGIAYYAGQRNPSSDPGSSAAMAMQDTTPIEMPAADTEMPQELTFAPSTAEMPETEIAGTTAQADPADDTTEALHTFDLAQEGVRLAATAGVSLDSIQMTDRLPPTAPMAMSFRRGHCVLLVNASIPHEGMLLARLTAYGQRQLTFTLGHEIGHCYMLDRVARRDPAILPALSPPGRAYSFEQYVEMSGRYNDYPDLNRWNEEWADTFAAFILGRVYGREFARSVTEERFSLRKAQEHEGSVLMSNIYGGHGVLAEDGLYNLQSPNEIANLVKLGRLNTRR